MVTNNNKVHIHMSSMVTKFKTKQETVELAQQNLQQEKARILRKLALAKIRELEELRRELMLKYRLINSQGESTFTISQHIKDVDNDITTERLRINCGGSYADFRDDLVFKENRKKFKVMFYD